MPHVTGRQGAGDDEGPCATKPSRRERPTQFTIFILPSDKSTSVITHPAVAIADDFRVAVEHEAFNWVTRRKVARKLRRLANVLEKGDK